MRAMARAEENGAGGAAARRVLVELRAVDNLYPLFGAVDIAPAAGVPDDLRGALARRDGYWGAVIDRSLLQIGQASWRDRGGLCWYVTVVGGCVKKQP